MLTYFLKQPDVVQLYMQSPIKEAAFLFLYPPEEDSRRETEKVSRRPNISDSAD
jgi:hypothetical protein